MKKRNIAIIIITICIILLSLTLLQKNNNNNNNNNNNTNTNLVAMVFKDGKYGYINQQGEYIIKPKYPLARTFSNGMACVNIDGHRIPKLGGVIGGFYVFIDLKDNIMLDQMSYRSPTSFYNNLALVNFGKRKMGYINQSGKTLFKDFDYLGPFNDGLASAVVVDKGLLGYIDIHGDWKINFNYNSGYTLYDFQNGLAAFKVNGRYGFIDKTGKIVIEPVFEYAQKFYEGLAAVKINGMFGFINKKGEIIIAPQYDRVGYLVNPYESNEIIKEN